MTCRASESRLEFSRGSRRGRQSFTNVDAALVLVSVEVRQQSGLDGGVEWQTKVATRRWSRGGAEAVPPFQGPSFPPVSVTNPL